MYLRELISTANIILNQQTEKTLNAKDKGKGNTTLAGQTQDSEQSIGSSYAANISYKPGSKLPLLSTRPAVTFQLWSIGIGIEYGLTSHQTHYRSWDGIIRVK